MYNFISKSTIEESLLDVLKFKKSVFAGVLDNGENEVFMGESKFKQFMRTVEKIADIPLQNINPNVAEQGKVTAEKIGNILKNDGNQQKQILEPMKDLFETGMNFLEKLKTVNISNFIEKDEQGRQSLKIPIPNEEIVQKAFSALGSFLEILGKNK